MLEQNLYTNFNMLIAEYGKRGMSIGSAYFIAKSFLADLEKTYYNYLEMEAKRLQQEQEQKEKKEEKNDDN